MRLDWRWHWATEGLQATRASLDQEREQGKLLREELAKANSERAQADSERRAEHLQAGEIASQELERARAEVEFLRRSLEKAAAEAEEARAEEKGLEARLAGALQECGAQQERCRRAEREQGQAQAECQELLRDASGRAERAGVAQTLLEGRVQAVQEQLGAAAEEAEEARGRCARLSAELGALSAWREEARSGEAQAADEYHEALEASGLREQVLEAEVARLHEASTAAEARAQAARSAAAAAERAAAEARGDAETGAEEAQARARAEPPADAQAAGARAAREACRAEAAEAELESLRTEARSAADDADGSRTALGLPPGPPIALNTAGRVVAPVGPPAGIVAAAAPAPAPAEPAAAVAAAGGAALGGLAAGLAAIAGAPGGDARIHTVTLDTQGVRYVDVRAAVVQVHELPWGDWPFKGPRTLLWVLSFICRNGGTPLGRHTKWVAEGYLEADAPGVDTHLLCCRLLELGVVYDQLHVTNLAAMELVGRTLQTQEELYRDRFAASSEFGSDAALMSGALDAGGNACVAPALRDWLASETAREASIARERRKAREERLLAAGGSSSDGRGRAHKGLRQSIMHISDSVDELGAPPAEFWSASAGEDGALWEFLSCANLHGSGAATSAPFVSDKVARPSVGAAPVNIVDVAQPADKAWLEDWRRHMLRDRCAAEALADSACPKGPYCNSALTRDVSTHGQFLIQMFQRQMVTFSQLTMVFGLAAYETAFGGILRLVRGAVGRHAHVHAR
ncbi:unnamed protein product [Prorocentrum cordatum]|uniref:Uncharacterized protein n=1 Tax=Prorocentrum cordatum TaxID=2364126 RepID=A0ABN9RVG3_9DINO|nr:unnamed protein product [Polarella glacialis]